MNLLYITFGENTAIHSQAAFSIYSFLACKQPINTITILTDAPDFYQHLDGQVLIEPVTPAQLQEWRGPHNFFWRIKIKAIQWLCDKYAGKPVLYLDTDTFLYTPWPQLSQTFARGTAYMHVEENKLSEATKKTQRLMWRQVKNKPFGGLTITETDAMWNAGVVATPNTKGGEEGRLALQICDEMCAAGVTPRLIEQFALSVALNHMYNLQPADGHIGHYWGNKEGWNTRITGMLTSAFLKGHITQHLVTELQTFDFTELPVYVRQKNTARKLHKYVNRFFTSHEKLYIGQKIENP